MKIRRYYNCTALDNSTIRRIEDTRINHSLFDFTSILYASIIRWFDESIILLCVPLIYSIISRTSDSIRRYYRCVPFGYSTIWFDHLMVLPFYTLTIRLSDCITIAQAYTFRLIDNSKIRRDYNDTLGSSKVRLLDYLKILFDYSMLGRFYDTTIVSFDYSTILFDNASIVYASTILWFKDQRLDNTTLWFTKWFIVFMCQHGNAPLYLVGIQSKPEVPALRRLHL
jgi:hypothetical protein